ncbi:Ubiquinone biosynthesis protein [Entomophthora muscae]|uniref:Ubiquinone biosynthesis protein n=1 Tax=Entomophthora muscae TaxID=34485 RepID=A0ACC2UH90_9FUNG|nr:Ubiquinone biosynthesis protein [Entomophthora muscae]
MKGILIASRASLLARIGLRTKGAAKNVFCFKSLTTQAYPGHVPLSLFGKVELTVISAFTALADPLRQDMVAALGETTGTLALQSMYKRMLLDRTGRTILKNRPMITKESMNFDNLRLLPSGTFGGEYLRFLEDHGVSPEGRVKVKYIDDPDLAYVMQRYRETHDFFHTLTGLSISVEAELALKYFEFAQFGLPMNALGAVFGPLALSSESRQAFLSDGLISWALQSGTNARFLLNVQFEECLNVPLDELRKRLNLQPVPKHLL